MTERYPEVRHSIEDTGELTKDTEELLVKGIRAFRKQFLSF